VVTFGIPPPSGIEARSHEGHGWPTFFLEETLLGSLPEFWRLSDQAAVDTLYTHRSLLLFFKQAMLRVIPFSLKLNILQLSAHSNPIRNGLFTALVISQLQ
jgi:hypothetical protein